MKDGTVLQWPWEYGYGYSSLVGLIKGRYPTNSESRTVGANAASSDKLRGDFVAEAVARATKSTAQAQYGIHYNLGGNAQWQRNVRPGAGQYQIYGAKDAHSFADGRSAAVKRGSEENLRRIEVRGDVMIVLVNGQELDRAQHPDLAKRGGSIVLRWQMTGPAADGDVEVRLTDFKVFDLAE